MLKTRGLVIRAIRYAETSIITDIFTEEKGLCSFIGGSVRTARSRMPFSLFQPMSPVELVSYWKDDVSALHRLKECRADNVLTAVPFEIKKGSIALFMAEVLRKCLNPGEPNEALFEYLTDTLRHLDTTSNPVSHLPLHFLIHLSGYLGFQPEIDGEDDHTLFFDLKEGETTHEIPFHGQYLTPEETQRLCVLLQATADTCHQLHIAHHERRQLLGKLLLYYKIHVEGFDEMNTPEVLEMVF